jgi:hypothetical protein
MNSLNKTCPKAHIMQGMHLTQPIQTLTWSYLHMLGYQNIYTPIYPPVIT